MRQKRKFYSFIPVTLCAADTPIRTADDLRHMLDSRDPLEVKEDGSLERQSAGTKSNKPNLGKIPDGILGYDYNKNNDRFKEKVVCGACKREVTLTDYGECPECGYHGRTMYCRSCGAKITVPFSLSGECPKCGLPCL